jgi:hypothetical protein
MKTREREPGHAHGLPPPPAPTARDANPWTISAAEPPRAGSRAGAPAATPRGSETGTGHRPRFPVRQVEHPKPRRSPIAPMLILAVVALVPLGAAVRALAAGAVADAIGPLIAVGFVAFVARRMLRRRHS